MRHLPFDSSISKPVAARGRLRRAVYGLVPLLVGMAGLAAESPYAPTIHRLTPGGIDAHPWITSILTSNRQVTVRWDGFEGPYQLQRSTPAGLGGWEALGGSTTAKSVTFASESDAVFFRIQANSPRFAGAGICADCHPTVHRQWGVTRHAHALDTLKRIGQDKNARCLVCHVVGLGLPTGFISTATTPFLGGVQCENCHGPSYQHALNPDELSLRPRLELTAKVCGGCHSGFHHPTYDEWTLSRHAIATPALQENRYAGDDCLHCHSQDYRYAVERGRTPPSLSHATLSVECATCHDAHGPRQEVAMLRKPIAQLCGECHTQGESLLGQSPHHPQFEMLQGIGAFTETGAPQQLAGTHTPLAAEGGQACAQCHVVKVTVPNPNEGNPNVTGHTFNPFDGSIQTHQAAPYAGCLGRGCHDTYGMVDFQRTLVQGEVDERIGALMPYFTPASPSYIDPAALTPAQQRQLQIAKFNYEYVGADGSLGVHNSRNTREALRVAETIVKDLKR